MQELAEELRDRGHKVTVATSYPYHNLSGNEKSFHFEKVSVENGIEVVRIKTLPSHGVGYLLRGISQLLLPYVFLYHLKRIIKHRVDVVIVYSPPLTLAITGGKVKKMNGARYILNVQDLFPQNAIDLGILKNKFLIAMFERIERNVYTRADAIAVHSEGNRKFLIEKKGVPSQKISTVHNWIDVEAFKNVQRTGIFRKRYRLENKFIFLFAGVIGPSQGLDFIIRVAKRLGDFPDICFLIVGDGIESERIKRLAERYRIENVYFKPFVSKEEYPLLVRDADVGLVSLSSKNKTPVVPGKILGYMAASLPVLAFLNKESDGHLIIKTAGCGYSAVSDDEENACDIIRTIYNEREKIHCYGENGFKYVVSNFSKGVCIGNLEKLFS